MIEKGSALTASTTVLARYTLGDSNTDEGRFSGVLRDLVTSNLERVQEALEKVKVSTRTLQDVIGKLEELEVDVRAHSLATTYINDYNSTVQDELKKARIYADPNECFWPRDTSVSSEDSSRPLVEAYEKHHKATLSLETYVLRVFDESVAIEQDFLNLSQEQLCRDNLQEYNEDLHNKHVERNLRIEMNLPPLDRPRTEEKRRHFIESNTNRVLAKGQERRVKEQVEKESRERDEVRRQEAEKAEKEAKPANTNAGSRVFVHRLPEAGGNTTMDIE